MSSTSVYGDHAGRWVCEDSPSLGPGKKGRTRLAVEAEWAQLARQAQSALTIFRLAGIYGEGRSAIDTLRRNPHVLAQTRPTADMIVSRIHVDDLVAALVAAIALADKPHVRWGHQLDPVIFNLADDRPASRQEVFSYAEDLLRQAGEQVVLNQLDDRQQISSVRNRDRASKKVSNAKMKQLLIPKLSYPTYKDGLREIAKTVLAEQ